jgi:hypothetical protein
MRHHAVRIAVILDLWLILDQKSKIIARWRTRRGRGRG